jgi:hypothetical protein
VRRFDVQQERGFRQRDQELPGKVEHLAGAGDRPVIAAGEMDPEERQFVLAALGECLERRRARRRHKGNSGEGLLGGCSRGQSLRYQLTQRRTSGFSLLAGGDEVAQEVHGEPGGAEALGSVGRGAGECGQFQGVGERVEKTVEREAVSDELSDVAERGIPGCFRFEGARGRIARGDAEAACGRARLAPAGGAGLGAGGGDDLECC